MDPEKITTNVFGTTGLPKYGAIAIDGTKTTQVSKLDEAFNTFMLAVKGLTAPGNEIALVKFGASLDQAYWPAYNCVVGKPVINGW